VRYEISRAKNLDEIASNAVCNTRNVEMTLLRAFLAPSLMKAAIEDRPAHWLGMVGLYHPQNYELVARAST
jgi:hypothetical protein